MAACWLGFLDDFLNMKLHWIIAVIAALVALTSMNGKELRDYC